MYERWEDIFVFKEATQVKNKWLNTQAQWPRLNSKKYWEHRCMLGGRMFFFFTKCVTFKWKMKNSCVVLGGEVSELLHNDCSDTLWLLRVHQDDSQGEECVFVLIWITFLYLRGGVWTVWGDCRDITCLSLDSGLVKVQDGGQVEPTVQCNLRLFCARVIFSCFLAISTILLCYFETRCFSHDDVYKFSQFLENNQNSHAVADNTEN